MNGILATLRREVFAYFFSPLAYVILTFFLFINGHFFWNIVEALSDPRFTGQITPFQAFFQSSWLFLLFITPMLTMRLLSEERKAGTIESLMTAPVTEIEVVLGKFLAAFVFYGFLWLPTAAYAVIIARSGEVDWGPIAAGYLGVAGVGALFLAIGVFGSSFTKNQIVAAIVTFCLLLFLLTLFFLIEPSASGFWKDMLGYVNIFDHLDEFGKGVVDTRRLVFYFSTAALFLFLSARALEAKKWR